MKKSPILLPATMMAALVLTSNARGQISPTSAWANTAPLSYTSGSVGIGSLTSVTNTPKDAWLHIYGQTSPVPGMTIVPYPMHSSPCTTAGYPNPELWIDRQVNDIGTMCGATNPPANYFQISNSGYGYTGHGFGYFSNNIDVFNSSGWLGVLQAKPRVALDVAGEGIIGNVPTADLVTGNYLTVEDIIGMWSSVDAAYDRGIHGNSVKGGLFMYSKSAYNDGSGVELWGTSSAHPGDIHFLCSGTDASAGFQFVSVNPSYHSFMNINKTGTVVIGGPGNNVEDIPVPTDYNYGLLVGDGILTERVKVAIHTTTDWSDYVFEKNYNLMPLATVASYINENNHLPEVPSAGEVVKNGIDLGGMDAKLLQKIEELTLYAIQQQKQIDELNKKVQELSK